MKLGLSRTQRAIKGPADALMLLQPRVHIWARRATRLDEPLYRSPEAGPGVSRLTVKFEVRSFPRLFQDNPHKGRDFSGQLRACFLPFCAPGPLMGRNFTENQAYPWHRASLGRKSSSRVGLAYLVDEAKEVGSGGIHPPQRRSRRDDVF